MSDMIRSLLNRKGADEPSENDFVTGAERMIANQDRLRNSGRIWSDQGGLEYCPRMGTWINQSSGRGGSLKKMCEGPAARFGG